MSQLVTIENSINTIESDFNEIACNSEKFKREALFSMQLLSKNTFLQKIAIGNPQSLRDAVLNVATLDVSLNPSQRHAYLVPRKGVVTLDISYMGLAHLAVKSGAVQFMQARIVYSKDTFTVGSIGNAPVHNYSPFGDRGGKIGVYCLSKLSTGDVLIETMSLDDVYQIRNRSESFKKGHGPWITDEDEMIKKTVIKRAFKMLPAHNSNLFNNASDYLNNDNGEGIDFEAENEEKKEEANKAIAQRHQDEKESYALKSETIEEIKKFSAMICKKYDMPKKVAFMKDELGVTSFTQLQDKGQVALAEILIALSSLNRENNKKRTAKDNVFTIPKT